MFGAYNGMQFECFGMFSRDVVTYSDMQCDCLCNISTEMSASSAMQCQCMYVCQCQCMCMYDIFFSSVSENLGDILYRNAVAHNMACAMSSKGEEMPFFEG